MWEWSHATEAYYSLYSHLETQPRTWLETVYAEWMANTNTPGHHYTSCLSEPIYYTELAAARNLSSESLAHFIYERAQGQSLCTNGGHEAYCCPFLCRVHALQWGRHDCS